MHLNTLRCTHVHSNTLAFPPSPILPCGFNQSEKKRRDHINVQVERLRGLTGGTKGLSKASVMSSACEELTALRNEIASTRAEMMALKRDQAAQLDQLSGRAIQGGANGNQPGALGSGMTDTINPTTDSVGDFNSSALKTYVISSCIADNAHICLTVRLMIQLLI